MTTAADYLTRTTLLRLLAVLLLVLAPHFLIIPPWATVLALGAMAWRALAAVRGVRLPPASLRAALALAAFAVTWVSFGRAHGLEAGSALLVIMLGLKLLEMRSRRDVMVVVFMMYFVLLTHFLHSQEIWTAAYLLVSAVAVSAVLMDAQHPGAPLPLRPALGGASRMLLQALPIMLLLFVLFPRIPGPLWGVPSAGGAATSGLSDTMAPGDILRLSLSDEIAFRVRFDDEPPPAQAMYWRGPVLWAFDGFRWNPGFRTMSKDASPVQRTGGMIEYEVTLEPHGRPWLFALEMPDANRLPADARLMHDYQLVSSRNVGDRRRYHVRSYTEYTLEPELTPLAHHQATRWPAGTNPRTAELAQRWREQGLEDLAIVQRALRMFREEPFHYTLEPPPLGRDSVDEFLFRSRRGFCEHYASSFTALMRAAAIPARVVTGYQGGERHPLGDFWVVRQSDAHAWSEVWLQGRGWVRVDPTAAVAPSRIESGLEGALAATGQAMPASWYRSRAVRYWVEMRWELVKANWDAWVLAYGPEKQQAFLSRFGIHTLRDMLLALTFSVVAVLTIVGLHTLRRAAPARPTEPAVLAWRRLTRRLARAGLAQHPHEGPQDYVERVAATRPDLADAVRQAALLYQRLRYLESPSPALERELRTAVATVRV